MFVLLLTTSLIIYCWDVTVEKKVFMPVHRCWTDIRGTVRVIACLLFFIIVITYLLLQIVVNNNTGHATEKRKRMNEVKAQSPHCAYVRMKKGVRGWGIRSQLQTQPTCGIPTSRLLSPRLEKSGLTAGRTCTLVFVIIFPRMDVAESFSPLWNRTTWLPLAQVNSTPYRWDHGLLILLVVFVYSVLLLFKTKRKKTLNHTALLFINSFFTRL